jgi:hypothetical protein
MVDHSHTGSQSLQMFSKNALVNGFTPAADRPLDHHLRLISARTASIGDSFAVPLIDVVAGAVLLC